MLLIKYRHQPVLVHHYRRRKSQPFGGRLTFHKTNFDRRDNLCPGGGFLGYVVDTQKQFGVFDHVGKL